MLRVLGILIAAALALPAAANASIKVTWPEQRTYVRGEKLSVKVVSTKLVRAVLVRQDASGRVTRVIARRILRKGTFTASAAGRYALKVGTRSRTIMVVASPPSAPGTSAPERACTMTGDRVELRLSTTTVHAGDELPFALANTSAGCLMGGDGASFERKAADGTWTPVHTDQIFSAVGVFIYAGESYAKTVRVPADAGPGTYRVLDSVVNRGGTIPVVAEFEVLP